MEKRKGYKDLQQQIEATKRYRQTENGKKKTTYSNYKSYSKKFIKELATLEDLQILEELIQERKEELK